MFIFRDPVSGVQFFGYSIALGGLIYYKLGVDKLKEYAGQGGRQWAEYGQTHPAMRKVIIFSVVIFALFLVLGGMAPFLPEQYSGAVKKQADSILGSVGVGSA